MTSIRLEHLQLEGSPNEIRRSGSTSSRQSALLPADRGKAAYQFLLASFLLEVFIWGYAYSFTTTLLYLETHEPWSRESTTLLAAVGTTQLGLQFILPSAVIFFFARHPEWIRAALWTSMVISCASQLVASWATKIWQLIVLQGVLSGSANAVIFTPVFYWLSQWWMVRRSTAYGLICSGIGIGGFAFPFMLNTILDSYGYAWLCRIWAITTACVFSLAIYMLKPRIPAVQPAVGRRAWLVFDRSIFRSSIFWLMGWSTLLAGFGYMPVALYLPIYSASITDSVVQQNLVLAIFSLVAAFGSAFAGILADRSYSFTVLFCGLAGTILGLSAWGTADNLVKVYIFAIFFALTGQMGSSWGAAAKDIAGANPNTATVIFCLFSAIRGVATIVTPLFSKALYDESQRSTVQGWGSHGFENMIIFVGSASLLSAMGGLAMQLLLRYFTS